MVSLSHTSAHLPKVSACKNLADIYICQEKLQPATTNYQFLKKNQKYAPKVINLSGRLLLACIPGRLNLKPAVNRQPGYRWEGS